MSSMEYITAKAHFIADSPAAKELAQRAVQVFANSDWGADEHRSNVEEGDGFTEVEAKVFGFGLDESLSSIEEVLEEAASLGNGSYGLLISESDFGLEGFDCYGDVELSEVDSVGEDVVWASEDFLGLTFTMEAGKWQEMLGCAAESLSGEIESREDELLPMLLPPGFLQACEEDGDVEFQYRDMEPCEFGGEGFGGHEGVTVIFDLYGHDLRHETFRAIADAINCPPEKLPVPGIRPLLSLSNAVQSEGVYESKMADINEYAMLAFKSSADGIIDVKTYKPNREL